MNRDSNGRFTSFKKKAENVAIVVVLSAIVISGVYAGVAHAKLNSISYAAPTMQPTRVQQVQALIDSLKAQREKDPTFMAKATKVRQDAEKQIDQMATEDALVIIKTQYDMSLDSVITN